MANSSKKRNPDKEASYRGVEKLLSASSYPSNKPSQQFKDRLFSELRETAFNEASMATKKTATAKEPRSGKVSWFRLPALAPVGIGVLAIVVISVGIFAYQQFQIRDGGLGDTGPLIIDEPLAMQDLDGAFELTALTEDDSGVAPDSGFQLTATIETSADKIKESLSFSPNVAYAVEATGDDVYTIKPKEPLEPGTVVNAELAVAVEGEDGTVTRRNFSWAYQVQEEFQVVSTLPRDEAVTVPIDTGIEVTFSHVGFGNAQENFTIEPNVSGRFETHRKTVAFIPDQPLEKETLYTVTIGADVSLPATGETLGENVLFQFETASKEGEGRPSDTPGISDLHQATIETSTEHKATLLVSGYNMDKVENAAITVYEFNTEDDYRAALESYFDRPSWTVYDRSKWHVDTNTLSLRSTAEVPLKDIENYWQYSIEAPETLPAGFYLFEVAGQNDTTLQALLNVTDINAYSTVSESTTVVWAHDASTDQPLSGAQVALSDGTVLGTTGEDGVLQTDTPESLLDLAQLGAHFLEITSNGSTLYVPLEGNAQGFYNEGVRSLPYWSYIYPDQPFYKPDDILNYWGLVSPRGGDTVSQATVQLTQGWQDDPVFSQNVELGLHGTFQGSFDLGGVTPGYYQLQVAIDDVVLFRKSVDVLSYVKPTYGIDINPQNIGVIKGDALTHDVTAAFFDGTPVAGLELTDPTSGGTLTTDENGHTSFTKTYSEEYMDWISVYPTFAEESEIHADARVQVFDSGQLIQLNAEAEATTASVSGTLYELDLFAFNNGEVSFWENPYGPVVPGYAVTVQVERHWYEKKQTGTHYDYFEKKVVPEYQYNHKTETIASDHVVTDDQGAFAYSFEMDGTSYYTVTARATDNQGRTTDTQAYVSSYAYDYGWNNNFFHLSFDNSDSQGMYSTQQMDFSLGDPVAVTMLRDNAAIPAADGTGFLFLQARDGIQEAKATDTSHYSFTYEEEDIPNVILQGVWYDGRSYWTSESNIGWFASGTSASFNEDDRKLTIDVTQDKDTYEPGDDVTLFVQVNRPDGSASETAVNVNLIDEAIYSYDSNGTGEDFVANYSANFIIQLYRDSVAGIYASYSSHRYPISEFGAEGGGGGDDRSNFPDKALFESVVTDENGSAVVEFKLPDNITSWRITTHAVDEGLYAASETDKLTVTQPFFVTAVMSDTFLQSDQPIVKIRAFGTQLGGGDPVTVTVSSDTLGMSEKDVETNGSGVVEVPLNNLTAGDHALKIKAEGAGYTDTIIRTFTVLPSYVAVPFSTVEQASAGWTPTVDTDRSFEVLFTDNHIGQFYPRLQGHLYRFGDRLDRRAGRVIAAEMMSEYFGRSVGNESFSNELYQTQDVGGVSLFPYSDDDLLLSAHIAASRLGDQFDAIRLTQYFDSILGDETETTLRHSFALYGLAAVGEPVLFEIDQMLASDQITDVDRLYLSLALAEIGSFSDAEVVFDALMTAYGEEIDNYFYLNIGDNQDLVLENTLVAAIIAAIIQDERADRLFNYVEDNWTSEVELVIPELNFMDARMSVLPQTPVTVSYEVAGDPYIAELSYGMTERVILTPETTGSFAINSIDGSATAITTYTRAATEEELNLNDEMTVSRAFESNTLTDGDLVRVIVSVLIPESLPDGEYQVTDFVPSGMRVVTNPWDKYGWYQFDDDIYRYPYLVDGQRVSFRAWDGNTTFSYYVRVVNKGVFTAEAPVLQSMNALSVRTIGNEETITIE
ncbi:MAG: Ig-like domain-containing protein [Candidatus Kerfeldbacteria bacterium]